MNQTIEKLKASHVKRGFDCGDQNLNEYLHKFANQNEKKSIGVTYVATVPESAIVLAFYSISSGQVACDLLPDSVRKKLPRYPVPVARIGRLATSLKVQGQGVGRFLLFDSLARILQLSNQLGIYAVEVDATNEQAKRFYQRMGFRCFTDNSLHLYLSVRTIQELLE